MLLRIVSHSGTQVIPQLLPNLLLDGNSLYITLNWVDRQKLFVYYANLGGSAETCGV